MKRIINKITYSTIPVFIFLLAHFSAIAKLVNAGILPYAYEKGKAYFLIGQEYEGTWADFGGNFEKTDSNPKYTAAREFSEETKYVFGKFAAKLTNLERQVGKRFLQESINYITPRITRELTHPKGYYKMYLAQVEHIPGSTLYRAEKVPHAEKIDYAWVPAEEFMQAIKASTDRLHAFYKDKQIRRQFYDILRRYYGVIMRTISYPQ